MSPKADSLTIVILLIILGSSLSQTAFSLAQNIIFKSKELDVQEPLSGSDFEERLQASLATENHVCGHEQLQRLHKDSLSQVFKVPFTNPTSKGSPGTDRHLQSGLSYGPLKIKFDYSQMDKILETSKSLYFAKYFIIKKNLQKVGNYITAFFKILQLGSKKLPSFPCLGYTFSAANFTEDLLINIFPQYNTQATYYAAASPCARSELTNQPVVGIFLFNLPYMGITIQDDYIAFGTFLHEFFHVLGFSSDIFDSFPVPNPMGGAWLTASYLTTITIDGVVFPALKEPNTLSAAQAHFGCSSLTAVPLENGGNSGTLASHYEKTFFSTELMNPTVEFSVKVSSITIAFLQATQWYVIDSKATQDWYFGKNRGCDFVRVSPRAVYQPEFCAATSNGGPFCSSDYAVKSNCINVTKYLDGNLLIKFGSRVFCDTKFSYDIPSKLNFESFSSAAACLDYTPNESNSSQPACVQSNCLADGTLQITLGESTNGQSFVCKKTGDVISIGSGSITCPDILTYCSILSSRCKNGCTNDANGFCGQGGQCFCYFGTANSATGICPEFTLSSSVIKFVLLFMVIVTSSFQF
jgi:Leishmanolysin